MKPKKKLSLTELKVNSFVTNENLEKFDTIKGGTAGLNLKPTLANQGLANTTNNLVVATTQYQTLNQATTVSYNTVYNTVSNNTTTVVIVSCFCNPTTYAGC